MRDEVEPASITVYPDGPLVVRGPFEMRSADGQVVETDRTVVALCRCGRSRLKPLCDGSHRSARFADGAAFDDIDFVLGYARPPARHRAAEPEEPDPG